ncbi:MAG TPA: hypothetical protein PKD27_07950 [Tepidiformaceae bacterium]|nr:hypothetical protein [Tepidiformaceae bacterium]
MDARIAVITGSVFAGVLVAGALAAPRTNEGPASQGAAAVAVDDPGLNSGVEAVYSYRDDDDDDDHGRDGDDDHERDHHDEDEEEDD